MSKATELTNQIIKLIYDDGGYAFRANSTGIYDKDLGGFRTAPKKGVSDVLGIYKGIFLAVEVKIGKDKLSLEQEGFLANVKYFKGVAIVAKDFDSFKQSWKWEKTMIDNL